MWFSVLLQGAQATITNSHSRVWHHPVIDGAFIFEIFFYLKVNKSQLLHTTEMPDSVVICDLTYVAVFS